MQRLRRLGRSHAFRRREVAARIRLPDDAARCGHWTVRHHWAADTASETPIARDGSECAGKDGLEFLALCALLDVLAVKLRHGHGLFLPLAVHAFLRTGKRDELDAGSTVAGSHGCVAGCGPNELWVLVGSEGVD